MRVDNPQDYQALLELQTMVAARNYNRWIWGSITRYMGSSILEIGAGIGTFTNFLKGYPKLYATDIADNCVEILQKRFMTYSNIKIAKFDITRISDNSSWKNQAIDTVICLNVLEHIEDDVAALGNIHSIICDHAKLILMVPAFQLAFGTIDRLDGHYRRYSKPELISKLKASGFSPLKVNYFNSIGLLAWFYTNKIARNKRTSSAKVKIYDIFFVPILSRVECLVSPPIGQSIIAVAEKT